MPLKVSNFTLNFSADPGAENLVVTLNAGAGAVYDTILLTKAMSGVLDLAWFPDGELILEPGDSLDFAQANGNSRTWGLQVTLREVT
jgi:hypothetical protein